MDRVSRRHNRRHSWPPVRLSKKKPIQKNIDENPFAFFISPPDETPNYLFDHVDAGIEPVSLPPVRNSGVKSRKPLCRWRQRAQAQKAVTKLKYWMRRMERFYRTDPLPQIAEVVPPPTLLAEHIGLPQTFCNPFEDHSEPPPPRQRRLKSHSARPRSWIDPPADLWTVFEENEDASTMNLGRSVPALPNRRPYP